MENQRLQADTAFGVHLRSYGFFHSGRERLQTRVLKRVWEHIPGGTLYGAVAAALIRLEGLDEAPPGMGTGDYHTLNVSKLANRFVRKRNLFGLHAFGARGRTARSYRF